MAFGTRPDESRRLVLGVIGSGLLVSEEPRGLVKNFLSLSSFVVTSFLVSTAGLAQSGIITTYAGPSLPVNGRQAITQAIDGPFSVALDGAGGFYVVSPSQNRVYRVFADGTLILIAGSSYGYSGDGGPATAAQLASPIGVAVDPAGNLYIADSDNGRIRKVTAGGVISTVAGNGTDDYSGDGGPATAAQLAGPAGVAVDTAGNLYIADTGNRRIRKVTAGGVINTVAGNGTDGYSGDGGPATAAQLAGPAGVAVDTAGNL
jgi:sugar lactone lactonase YvrE